MLALGGQVITHPQDCGVNVRKTKPQGWMAENPGKWEALLKVKGQTVYLRLRFHTPGNPNYCSLLSRDPRGLQDRS